MDLRVAGSEGLASPGMSCTFWKMWEGAVLSEPSREGQREGQRLPEGQPGGSERQSGDTLLRCRAGSRVALMWLFWVWKELFSTDRLAQSCWDFPQGWERGVG